MSIGLIEPAALPERCGYEVAAVYLGISYMTVRDWVAEGRLPKPRRFGRTPFFRREDLIAIKEVPRRAEVGAA